MMHIKFLKSKRSMRGYVLLVLMLAIGTVGIYLSYQFVLKKNQTQSWQLAKTMTEFSYWFDMEQNYEQDYNITSKTDLNNIQLANLIQQHYLPYGLGRNPTFKNSSSDQVSEFACSSLPGISVQDIPLTLDGTDQSCPMQAPPNLHCDLAPTDQVYYSCANNAAGTISQAQYYVNANHISIGNNQAQAVGLGLIVRTPGNAVTVAQATNSTQGILPNGSLAQSLISTLPGAAFNVYTTPIAQVNGIGLASYLSSQPAANMPENYRYSKIVDMGVVQAVPLDTVNSTTPCYGWDPTTGNKTGVQSNYTGSNNPGTGTNFPPTCIRIDTSKYGWCQQLDVLYTAYRTYTGNNNNSKTNTNFTSEFYSYTDSYVQANGAIRNVFLGAAEEKFPPTTPASEAYVPNGSGANQYTWIAYIVRCKQNNA